MLLWVAALGALRTTKNTILHSWQSIDEEAPSLVTSQPRVSADLETKVREYLAARASRIEETQTMREKIIAKREAAMANPLWRAGNYLFSLESLLPEAPDDDDDEKTEDALAYTELERFGYGFLVEEIMDAGGHIFVSEALGIATQKRPPPRVELKETPPPVRGVRLGASLDAALAAGASTINSTKEKSDRTVKLPVSKKRREVVVGVRYKPDPPMPVEWPALLAPLSLGIAGRVYATVALLLIAATPDAPATLDAQKALAPYIDPQPLFDLAHAASFACLAANAVAVAIALVTAPRRKLYAATRAAFAGPLALLEDRRRPPGPYRK